MQLNKRTAEQIVKIRKSGGKAKWLVFGTALAVLCLLVAACGDSTATSVPPTVAAPAATTSAATTAAATTAVMTTSAATTAAMTTSAATTAAMTSAPATTAAMTTNVATTAASGASTGTPRIVLDNPSATAGTTIPVTGDGFPPNTWLTLQFGPGTTTLGVASLALTDGTGKFATQIIMVSYGDGSKLVPGSNTLKGITEDGSITATTTFTVVPAPATATPKA